MANFNIELAFMDLKSGPAPKMVDLLFFDFEARHDHQQQHYARGWVGEDGHLFLIGGQWEPTHYAYVPDFYAAAQHAGEAGGGVKKGALDEK